MTYEGILIKYAVPEIRAEKKSGLAAVQQDGWALLFAGQQCQMDVECIRAAKENVGKEAEPAIKYVKENVLPLTISKPQGKGMER